MPSIFISYRRADSISITGRIYDRLVAAFGEKRVFKDVDDIPIGADFRRVLQNEVGACDVLLVIIGQRWLNVTDDEGDRRLDDPDDFVRIEVEYGLQRDDLIVIPVTVNGASLPKAAQLPEGLRELVFRNGAVVRDDPDFNRDVARLINQLKQLPARKTRRTGGAVPRSRLPLVLGAALLLVLLAVGLLALLSSLTPPGEPQDGTRQVAAETSATPDTEAATAASAEQTSPAQATTAVPTEADAPPTAAAALPGDYLDAQLDTRMSYINVRAEPQPAADVLGIVPDGAQVRYLADSRTGDDWFYVQYEDLAGWVNGAYALLLECFVADGYDAPVGTEEERRSTQIWPGEWRDASVFGELYFVGTPSEAVVIGADLNIGSPYEDLGEPVYAIASGEVTFAGELPVWGNVIVIRHDPLYTCDGEVYFSRYGHVGEVLVSAGERVQRGQQITSIGDGEGRYVPHLGLDLSQTSILEIDPGYFPGADFDAALANFIDSRAFIEGHRPPGS